LAFRAFSIIRFSGVIIHSILGIHSMSGMAKKNGPSRTAELTDTSLDLFPAPGASVLSAGDTQRGLP
jgi:hypothetical protein